MATILPPDDKTAEELLNKEQNDFNTHFFEETIKSFEEKTNRKKLTNPLISKINAIITCKLCDKYLTNPFYSPECECCACKICYDKYFSSHQQKYGQTGSNLFPCPICNKTIHSERLISLPNFMRIEPNLLKTNYFTPEDLIDRCPEHKNNKINIQCIDCNKQLCMLCFLQKMEEHKNHHLLNYEQYLDIGIFFKKCFKELKLSIERASKYIKEYKNFKLELEQENKAFNDFLNEIKISVDSKFKEAYKEIDDIITNLCFFQTELNDKKNGIKNWVGNQIQVGYFEFGNIVEIKKEILAKTKKINLNIPLSKGQKILSKNLNIIDLAKLDKICDKQEKFYTADKENLLKNKEIILTEKNNENFIFSMEITKDNKGKEKYVKFVLKILKEKNKIGSLNILQFFTEMEKNGAIFFLNKFDRTEQYDIYEKVVPLNDIFLKNDKVNIKVSSLEYNIIYENN